MSKPQNIFKKVAFVLGLKFIILIVKRLHNNNRVFSLNVSVRSLVGNNITIMQGTQIDDLTSIGSYTYIGKNCNVTRSKIERFVSIGNNVTIGPGEHDLKRLSTSSLFYENPYEELTQGECIIESDVWIGVNAIVMRGVRVGIGAAVAASAVVTKDVPDFAVVAGVPAKVIRYRFDENIQTRVKKSKWWLFEQQEASKILEKLAKDMQ